MKLKNGYSEVEIALHSLKQGSTNVASFTNSDIFSDVENDVPLLTTFDETPVKIDPDIAKGRQISLSKELDNGSMFKIDAMAVTHKGKAGTTGVFPEICNLSPGDFKFNIGLSDWKWLHNESDDSFVDLSFEIAGSVNVGAGSGGDTPTSENKDGTDSAETSPTKGMFAKLVFSNQYFVFDEDTKEWQQHFMKEGYPKLTKSAENGMHMIVTVRFFKFTTKLFYDPILEGAAWIGVTILVINGAGTIAGTIGDAATAAGDAATAVAAAVVQCRRAWRTAWAPLPLEDGDSEPVENVDSPPAEGGGEEKEAGEEEAKNK